jgi:hypothetical protein
VRKGSHFAEILDTPDGARMLWTRALRRLGGVLEGTP